MHNQLIVIEPPVRGHWAIYNPPGHPVLAYDFLAEDASGSLYRKGGFLRHLVTFIPVEDTRAWSRPVFSPVNGTVAACHDTENDRMRLSFAYDLLALLMNKPKVPDGFGAFGGNHLLIETGGYYILLCHLKKDSAKIKKGDQVKAGQQLAEVGNSGSSIQPHLHIQVMRTDRYFPLFANLLPLRISHGEVRKGSGWAAQREIELKNRGHYMFAGATATWGGGKEPT